MDPFTKRMLIENIITIAAFTALGISLIEFAKKWLVLRYKARDTAIAPADDGRLARLEASVEAIAIEVERISEGQRFVTRLLAERDGAVAALPDGSAAPHAVRDARRAPVAADAARFPEDR